MDNELNVKRGYFRVFVLLALLIVFCGVWLGGCGTAADEKGFRKTISAQDTQIAYLSTQLAQQERTNWSQWNAISYLATQMPVGGKITPLTAGDTITPTPYIPLEQDADSTWTPTP
jgi:hypothetical protein